MARTSVTHSAAPRVPPFLFLPHFDVICDLLLNRRTATWNLFVKYIMYECIYAILSSKMESCYLSFTHYAIIRLQLPHEERAVLAVKSKI